MLVWIVLHIFVHQFTVKQNHMVLSITLLENRVKTLKETLEAQGFEVDMEVNKMGQHSPSNITLVVEHPEKGYSLFRILANGYGANFATEISTANGWKAAKKEILTKLNKIT